MPLHGTVGQLLNRLIAAGVGQRPVVFVTHRSPLLPQHLLQPSNVHTIMHTLMRILMHLCLHTTHQKACLVSVTERLCLVVVKNFETCSYCTTRKRHPGIVESSLCAL